MTFRRAVAFAWLFFLGLGMTTASFAQGKSESIRLTHVHGAFFSADGARLLIPGHRGIAVFGRGTWARISGDESDFAGFTGSRDAWYASGHAGLTTDTVSALGLGRSTDEGRTWQTIGVAESKDFHHLSAGYRTGGMYVYNHDASASMPLPGIYNSRNRGLDWSHATSTGLSGEIAQLAAHCYVPH